MAQVQLDVSCRKHTSRRRPDGALPLPLRKSRRPTHIMCLGGCNFVYERQVAPVEEINDPPHIAPMENRPRLAPIDTRVGASFAQSPTELNSPSSSSSSWPFVSRTVFSTPSGILQGAAGLPVYPSAYREGGQQDGHPMQPALSVVARSVAVHICGVFHLRLGEDFHTNLRHQLVHSAEFKPGRTNLSNL